MASFASLHTRRNMLYVQAVGLALMAAAVTAVSARDSDGAGLRAGMVMLTAGVMFALPWRVAVPAAVAVWLVPNYMRSVMDDAALFSTNMLLELPGLLGVAAFSLAVRFTAQQIESLSHALGTGVEGSIDPETGLYDEKSLRPAIEAELTRSRRFEHPFALVLAGIDEKHQRFGYREEDEWKSSFLATAQLLRRTRTNIDRVYRHGPSGFALLLPESGVKEVNGLVRRLRKLATSNKPREGQPGGPLPVAFGATFFPSAASSVDDMLRRAEIALRVAVRNSNRMQLDGAEAPALASPETMRHPDSEEFSATEGAAAMNVSDVWVAEPDQKPAGAPVQLRVVPMPEPVTTLLPGSDEVSDTSQETADAESPPMSDEDLTQLLGRLDETLGLIRGLRSKAS